MDGSIKIERNLLARSVERRIFRIFSFFSQSETDTFFPSFHRKFFSIQVVDGSFLFSTSHTNVNKIDTILNCRPWQHLHHHCLIFQLGVVIIKIIISSLSEICKKWLRIQSSWVRQFTCIYDQVLIDRHTNLLHQVHKEVGSSLTIGSCSVHEIRVQFFLHLLLIPFLRGRYIPFQDPRKVTIRIGQLLTLYLH